MQQLLFFSRVAFICNVCFVVAAIFQFVPSLEQGHFVSTVLILGILVSVVLNSAVNMVLVVHLLGRKRVSRFIPAWLIIFNFLCLIPQLIFFLQ